MSNRYLFTVLVYVMRMSQIQILLWSLFEFFFCKFFLYSPDSSKMTLLCRSGIVKTSMLIYSYTFLLLSFYPNFLGEISSTFYNSFFAYFKKNCCIFVKFKRFFLQLLILS